MLDKIHGFFADPNNAGMIRGLSSGLLGSAPTEGDRWRQGLLGMNQAMQQQQEMQMQRELLDLKKQQMSQPRPEDIVAVIDPATGQPTYVPKSRAIGMAPMPKSPLVQNVIGSGQEEFVKEQAKGQAKRIGEQAKISDELTGAMSAADEIEMLLNEGFTPGTTAGARGAAAGLLSDIGSMVGADTGNIGRVAAQSEAYKAASNKLALAMKAGMTGAMSDQDIKFLTQQAPQISDTPDGARRKIEIIRRMANRERQKLVEMQKWAGQNNGSLDGFDAYWQEKAAAQPLFADMYQGNGGGQDQGGKRTKSADEILREFGVQ